MIAFLLAGLASVALLPAAGRAGEVRLGLGTSQQWQSNAQNTATGEDDEFSWRVSPRITVEDQRGDLAWRLNYRPTFKVFYSDSDLNGIDHSLGLSADLQVSPQTTLRLTESFVSTQSTSTFNEETLQVESDATPESVFRRRRVNRNNVDLSLSHRLSLAQSLVFSIGHTFRDDDDSLSRTGQTFRASSRYRLATTERSAIGFGFTFTRQHLDSQDFQESTDTDFYNAFGSIDYAFSPTFRISLTGGPALVDGGDSADAQPVFEDTELYPVANTGGGAQFVFAASCPTQNDNTFILDFRLSNSRCQTFGFPLSGADLSNLSDVTDDLRFFGRGSAANTRLTFFANGSLLKSWERWNAALSYRRTASESGITSEIVDSLRANLSWQPAPRWNVGLSGAVVRRTQATEGQLAVAVVVPEPTTTVVNGVLVPGGAARRVGFSTTEVDNDLEQLQYFAEANARYRVQKRLSVFARFFYSKQSPQGDVQVGDDFDEYRVNFGLDYQFEPFYF